ncbi:MAG: hypothetical protein UX25_C0050G0003 [Candidatus Woesebacteria bacterium GW2011_GWC2_45_9]|uniref:Antitoxin n=2 Tax=Microgenomates group TaxID=1794810 RepID=A0A0G1R4Z1_9BACT|nr:MAG: hypothetical protein UW61_C0011G0011 [Candidatus Curtissbacteria bacterium GW2011_GWC1_44_33]KKU15940.1 MAG: hypothetical protein UX25_C0050G0003 [Candidatus Woesebacteria bacterium GW2011_GWC2_45_9]
MKYFDLTKEELEIEKAFREGKLVHVKNFKKVKKALEETAKNTLNKTRNINLRVTEKTLYKLKAKAVEEGIPYQTLASSILRKYASQ